MNENKMAEVAKMFGKEIGDRFTVYCYGYRFNCWFIGGYFEVFNPPTFTCNFDEVLLYKLIRGDAVIVDD